jgi:Rrf2 family protein
MLTQTTEIAIRALLHIAQLGEGQLVSAQAVAERIGSSPTYMVKTLGHLIRAGILRSHRGTQGGVTIDRAHDGITLLEIVEACQGKILGDFCQNESVRLSGVCAYHRAMLELHEAIIGTLSRWTLADLLKRPQGISGGLPVETCKMRFAGLVDVQLPVAATKPKRRSGRSV